MISECWMGAKSVCKQILFSLYLLKQGGTHRLIHVWGLCKVV